MSEEVFHVWKGFSCLKKFFMSEKVFHVWRSFSCLKKFFMSERVCPVWRSFMTDEVTYLNRLCMSGGWICHGWTGQYVCQVLNDCTVPTTLTMWRDWQCDAIDRVTLLAMWRHWQGDYLGNVTPLKRCSVTHFAMWRPPWQGDALGNVTPLRMWRSWQCDAVDNVTQLTMWRSWQCDAVWQSDSRESGDAFWQKMPSSPRIPSIY